MPNESTPTAPVTSESIALAAQALRGTDVAKALPTEDVAKATDPKDEKPEPEAVAKAEAPAFVKKEDEEEDDDKKVAKALAALDLPGLIASAVTSALAPVQAELAEVRKSLGVVEDNTQSTLNFQDATTSILTGLKTDVAEQREVQKSVQATVDAVAAQPAGRKSALSDVAKAVTAAPALDLEPLREWAASQNFDRPVRVAMVHEAAAGQIDSRIPQSVRKAMGVTI